MSSQFTHVMWAHTFIVTRKPGESLRDYYATVGLLRHRANGELDMRYRASRAVIEEEHSSI